MSPMLAYSLILIRKFSTCSSFTPRQSLIHSSYVQYKILVQDSSNFFKFILKFDLTINLNQVISKQATHEGLMLSHSFCRSKKYLALVFCLPLGIDSFSSLYKYMPLDLVLERFKPECIVAEAFTYKFWNSTALPPFDSDSAHAFELVLTCNAATAKHFKTCHSL